MAVGESGVGGVEVIETADVTVTEAEAVTVVEALAEAVAEGVGVGVGVVKPKVTHLADPLLVEAHIPPLLAQSLTPFQI